MNSDIFKFIVEEPELYNAEIEVPSTSIVQDYNDSINKPKINNVELKGNKSLSDLGITNYDDSSIRTSINTINGNISSINNNINSMSSNISTLSGRVNSNTSSINSLNANKANVSDIPTKTSNLTNDSNYVNQSYVSANYATKSEIPDTSTFINKNVNDLTNYYKKSEIDTKIDEVEGIAKGRATGYVFNTKADMDSWIPSHKNDLTLGDNLYIKALNVPDYWWDGTQAQELETQKVDLTEYAKTSQLPTKTSELANDSGFLTQHQDISGKQDKLIAGTGISIDDNVISNTQTSAEWGNIEGTLSSQTDLQTALNAKADATSIPTNVSDLNNDSGFVTSSYHDSTKQDATSAITTSNISTQTVAKAGALNVTGAKGSSTQPVYINANGIPVACTKYDSASVASAASADKANALNVSAAVGGSTTPVYINANGVPTACTAYSKASVASATKATQDKNGKDITTQYATASAVSALFKAATLPTNLNNCAGGTYVFNTTASNRPSGIDYGVLLCIKNPDFENYTFQIAIGVTVQKMAYRGGYNSTWQNWKVI